MFIFFWYGEPVRVKSKSFGPFKQKFAVCGQFCTQYLFMTTVLLLISRKCCLRHIRSIFEFLKLSLGVLKSYLTQVAQFVPFLDTIRISNQFCFQKSFMNLFYEMLPKGTSEVFWSPGCIFLVLKIFNLWQIFRFCPIFPIFTVKTPSNPD